MGLFKMAKKALLTGINDYKYVTKLRGCVNDVRNMTDVLTNLYSFKPNEIRTLVDESVTRDNLVNRLDWLIDGAVPGDLLYFHFSGHGSQVLDRDGDELNDNMDEILCLYDMDFRDPNSYLLDDDFSEFIDRLPKGVFLTVCIDSCHSGTATRDLNALQSELQIPNATAKVQSRFIKPPADIDLRSYGKTFKTRNMGSRIKEDKPNVGLSSGSKAKHVLLAGCRDEQTSADALIGGDYNGAFTYYLCKTLRSKRGAITYQELVENVRNSIAYNSYSQIPQLNGNEDLRNVNFMSALPNSGIKLTCDHGHPLVCAEGHPVSGYTDPKEEEKVRKENEKMPIAAKRINISIKKSKCAVSHGVILDSGSDFTGNVRDVTKAVTRKSNNGTRDFCGDAYNPKSIIDHLEDEDFRLMNVMDFSPNQQRALDSNGEMKPLSLAVKCNEDEEAILMSLENGALKWHIKNEGEREKKEICGNNVNTFAVPFKRPDKTKRGFFSKVVYCFKTTKNIFEGKTDEVIHSLISKYESKKINQGFKEVTKSEGFTGLNKKEALSGGDWNGIRQNLQNSKKGLLFIHGTASSLEGGYSDIPTDLVERMYGTYNSILGYDHYSLSLTPKQNAENMIEGLKNTGLLNDGVKFDVVTHSRGGLVLRSFVELLQGQSNVDNAIMVACPAAGTTLADPSRWESVVKLLNLLSNISFLAGGPAVKITFNLMGILLKFVSSKIKNKDAIPGLWAMNPNAGFIEKLNDKDKVINNCTAIYNTIGSNFEPTGIFKGGVGDDIIDSVADAFFGHENDLVVDTKNMDLINWPQGVKDGTEHIYAPDKHVHHLNYFRQVETLETFSKVFGLGISPNDIMTSLKNKLKEDSNA